MCSETERHICPNDLLCSFFLSLRFVANHVCMLRCCASGFGFWSQSNTTDMFCLHILAPAKVALCSLWSGLYPCESTLWFPLCFAIQWPSQALSSLNTCNYSHYPQSPPALPLCLSRCLSFCSHFPLAYTQEAKKKRKKWQEMCDRWSRNWETAKLKRVKITRKIRCTLSKTRTNHCSREHSFVL